MTQVRLTNYESSIPTGIKVIEKSQTAYTITTTDLEGCNHLVVHADGLSGDMTVTIPSESDYENKMITVIMVNQTGMDNVYVKDSSGSTFRTFTYTGDFCEFASNGSTRLDMQSLETEAGP